MNGGAVTLVIFDLLWNEGDDLTGQPFRERRNLLESLDLSGPTWTIADTFDDGPALYTAVCELGFGGVVAKKLTSRYRPNERGWVKSRIRVTGVVTRSLRCNDSKPRAAGASSRVGSRQARVGSARVDTSRARPRRRDLHAYASRTG